jgi:hypothetical protein
VTSRKDFDAVLKIVDTNNGLDEEIEDFNTYFLEVKPPSLIDKQIFRQDDRHSFPDPHVYSADESERAFYET